MLSKTWLVFLIVYFSSNFSHGQRNLKFFRADYKYIEAVESFYKIHTSLVNWHEAKWVCTLEGANLFYPENDSEALAVRGFWNSTYPNADWPVFVGLSDLLAEGVFETIDGKSISNVYNNWRPDEPSNGGNSEDCVELYSEGHLNDVPCDYMYRFICKKTLQSLEWNYHCNMSNLDYVFNKDIGKCYKLHTTPLNWNDAHAVCRAELSYLAMVANRTEAVYLASLTKTESKRRVSVNYRRGIYHMGFHNKLNKGWQTVKGTPINDDADAWWNNYRPNGDEHDEQCGSMFFNGRLNTINCDTKSFFICEHEVNSSNLNLESF